MRKANLGDLISFERRDIQLEGRVEIIRDNSMIVEISREAALQLGYENNKTVVKHNHYIIKSILH
ncbi:MULTISPECIES: DUF2187 family protein [Bacillota]|uniref:DUF2187 family protein n=1 Tax=Bacillota TaxID=1239 RepID=UPI0039EEDD90